MTKEELRLVEKILDSEKVYICARSGADNYFEIFDIQPSIYRRNDTKSLELMNYRSSIRVIEDFGVLWAFDKETLERSENERQILIKQKEIEKLQKEIKDLEKQL